jgi:hypothetical protein
MPCLGWRISFWSRINCLFGAEKFPVPAAQGMPIQRLENASRIMPRPAQRREIFAVSLIISLFSGVAIHFNSK